jgi:putative ABC transport system substrate-binding protein
MSIVLAVSLLGTACTPAVLTPVFTRPTSTAHADVVVVLKSDDNPLFEQLLESFYARSDATVRVYSNVSSNIAGRMNETLRRDGPNLVLCLGPDAAAYAQANVHESPVLFALVPPAQELGLRESPNFMGVSVTPRPELEFSQFKMVLPRLHRVVVFFDPLNSQALINQAQGALKGLGIELLSVPVKSLAEIQTAFATASHDVDAVWLLADPIVINRPTFEFLRDATLTGHVPLLTSLSEGFSEAGALMSVSVDINSVGSQVALLAHKVLHQGQRAGQIGVQPPFGVSLAVNLDTAAQIGVPLTAELLGTVNRIYTSDSAQ